MTTHTHENAPGRAEAPTPTPEVVCGADRASEGDSVRPVAALYVDVVRGPYASMPGVDAWGVERDATKYDGPHPVVAHPPCGQWAKLRHLAKPNAAERDCGPIAVEQVRKWGGVLEQPADSRLWFACALPLPGELPDAWGGFSIEVEQVAWGHPARKKTWLYFVGCSLRDVVPGVRTGGTITHWCSGTYTPGRRGTVPDGIRVLSNNQRHLTPPAFAEWLVEVARRCEVNPAINTTPYKPDRDNGANVIKSSVPVEKSAGPVHVSEIIADMPVVRKVMGKHPEGQA